MATPMIIIGIGTSGLKIIEQTQRFYYETMKESKPKYVEYIYLETNKDNLPSVAGTDNPIKRVYISLKQLDTMVFHLKQNTDAKWLPKAVDVSNAGMGAGGIRPIGRLGLWGTNNESNNFSNVYDTIDNAYKNVGAFIHKETGDNEVAVYIVGSLTGGTGSGVFIDMGYIVRDIIKNTRNVYGLFLLPSNPRDITKAEMAYANAYGALVDLDKFNQSTKKYVERWPINKEVEFNEPPFELAYFISQDYKDGSPAIRTLDGLYKMSGLFMFLNMMGMHAKRFERLVDATSNKLIDRYATFGLSGIHFPKEQIQEYVASMLGRSLFTRWTDENNFVVNNEVQPINYAIISQGTENKWDSFLSKAFKALNTVGGQDLVRKIEYDAIQINKKEVGESDQEYIRKMFSSNTTDQLYSTVQGNLQLAVNSLIDSLYDFNIETLNRHQNLPFAKATLEGFINAIEECLNYWESMGIYKEPSQWNDFLGRQLKWITDNRYKSILEQDGVVADRMLTIFEQLKMHLMASKLREIIEYISKYDIAYASTESRKELPKLKKFDEFIRIIKQADGSIDSNNNSLSLQSRMSEIKMDVEDVTIPILRIFPAGSFNQEVENARGVYGQKTSNAQMQHSDITNENLWEFLNTNSTDLQSKLYGLVSLGYKNKVDSFQCVDDRYDLMTYIDKNSDEVNKIAKRGVSGFISVDKPLQPSMYIPRLIIANDRTKISNTVKAIQTKNNTDFTDNETNALVIPEIKNLLVFYDEKGNFEPLKDLTYIKQMKDSYTKKPRNLASNIDDATWQEQRNAYLSEDIVEDK